MTSLKVSDSSRMDPLQLPENVSALKLSWSNTVFVGAVHLLALLAFFPSLFSLSGLIVMSVTAYVCGCLGINICYHRLLTHKSFESPRWFTRVLTVLAACNLEGSSLKWPSVHRRHHEHSDERPDPHSPLVNFLWSHIVWVVVYNPGVEGEKIFENTKDLQRDPFHLWMHTYNRWVVVWFFHIIFIFSLGFAIGILSGEMRDAFLHGLSFVVWGVFVRMVLVWHATWLVNSATHMWGYQNYKSSDEARNNWWVALLTWGEGWHNNHHADQRSACNQHRWWEIDLSYYTIRLFAVFGLAKKIKTSERNAGSRLDPALKAK